MAQAEKDYKDKKEREKAGKAYDKARTYPETPATDEPQKKPSRLHSAGFALASAPVVLGSKMAEYGSKLTKGRVSDDTQDKLWGKSEKIGQSMGRGWKGLAKHAVGLSDDPDEGMKKGGRVKRYAKGGSVSSASKRADGIAQRGKTKGRML